MGRNLKWRNKSMASFSERYGYTQTSDVIIREKITPEIQTAILNCYDRMKTTLPFINYSSLEMYLWTNFLNKRDIDFNENILFDKSIVFTEYIEDSNNEWYKKLDLIELTIKYLYKPTKRNYIQDYVDSFPNIAAFFITQLNNEFKRLNFAYRIVNKEIVEITSEEEISTIEEALNSSKNNIRIHLNKALELYAQKPTGDHRNSIKESISAVEAFCREKTEEDTLGKALNKLESNGIIMPKLLKIAFDKLYAYTNQPDTGIRHALMDDEGSYVPQAEEALFMLVSCSAFINYLNKKVK